MARGRFIDQRDMDGARNVVVIGPDLKQKLLPQDPPSGNGSAFATRDLKSSVRMVLKAVFGQNQDEAAYIPLTTMVSKLSGRDPTYGVSLNFISVEAVDEASTGAAKFQITNLLRQRHNILREDDFAVRSQRCPVDSGHDYRRSDLDVGGHWRDLATCGWHRDHEHHVGLGQ